jgi:flagellar motor switch protein FliM
VSQLLSQAEMDALLAAVDGGALGTAGGAAGSRPVVPYNFRKPNRVSKDQVKTLSSIHETFARLFTSSLSTLSRGLVEVELRTVEQWSHAEFVASLSAPTCVAIFHMEPLKGAAALDVSAPILFRLIDRLLGGSGLLPVRVREFTEVEQALVERVAMRAMADLRQAWQYVGTFGFRVVNLETSTQFVQLTAPNEVVIAVGLDIRIGDVEGQIALGYPHLLIEPVMDRLNLSRALPPSQRPSSAEERASLHDSVLRLTLGVRGVLTEFPLSVRDLLDLRPGDVLTLPCPTGTPAVVELEGIPRYTAALGTVRRRRALRLLSVTPQEGGAHGPDRRIGSERLRA